MSQIKTVIAVVLKLIKPRRKLERITSSFDKTIRDLRNLRRAHTDRILQHHERISKIRDDIQLLDREATQADAIALNIERLLG